MGGKFAEIAFTDTVKAMQETMGSRAAYARRQGVGDVPRDRLGEAEADFIAARDSFYMASVGETGWPYMQHRGGPTGFVRIVDEGTIGFADFSGNRQYVSVGNLMTNQRVSLFFMDYPNRARLKIYGYASIVAPQDETTLARLAPSGYKARIERGMLISVAGFDWNCPQHITPRYTADDIAQAISPLKQRIAALEAELAQATSPGSTP